MAVPIARRNLFESPVRSVVSMGGVALAMVLVLALDGVFVGALRGVTAYIDATSFDVVVSQKGVRNLHMTASQFPIHELDRIRSTAGVAEVDPILFTTAFAVFGNQRNLVYLIGYEPGKMGGPAPSTNVPRALDKGDILIDEQIASEMGVSVGDTVTALGKDFRVAGLVSGTVSVTNSVAFIRFDDFEAAARLQRTASFGLIRVRRGEDPSLVATRIRGTAGDLTVQTKPQFADSERRIVSDMSTDILRIMNLVGFLIGLAVVGLTVYTATLGKLKEYGVLKAIGAPGSRIFATVFGQAVMSVGIGLATAVALTLVVAFALGLTDSNIRVLVELSSVVRVAIGAGVVAVLASAIPIARVARIEPADVFRR